jgi:hypothetical protein
MKRLSSLLAILLLAFYVAWPGYSAYEIHQALEARDAAALEGRIDFASLRESLRPAATAEAERTIDEQVKKAGGTAGVLAGEIAKKSLPKLVEVSLDAAVTPQNIIRIYAEGGSVKETLTRIVQEQLLGAGGLTGLGTLGTTGRTGAPASAGSGGWGKALESIGKAAGLDLAPAPPTAGAATTKSPVRTVGTPVATSPGESAAPKPSYGLSNIKKLGPTGPFTMEVGIAKDASAKEPDVTAEMGFTGTGWKLTGLRPKL